jgi:predicted RNase H-like HicB family nuclease
MLSVIAIMEKARVFRHRGDYVAVSEQAPGLSGIGDTEAAALAELEEAAAAWLELLEEEKPLGSKSEERGES